MLALKVPEPPMSAPTAVRRTGVPGRLAHGKASRQNPGQVHPSPPMTESLLPHASEPERESARARRLGGLAGVVGPAVFVATFVIEGWVRPGYESASTFVSALSLGPRGWVQITSFVVTGSLVLVFSRGLAAQFSQGVASRWGPRLVAIVGAALLGSGPFVMDPMGILFPQMSWHGKVHSLLGAVVFSLGPASSFVFARRFRVDPAWRSAHRWTLMAGVVMTSAVILLKLATLPPPAPPSALNAWAGLIQRVAILGLMGWFAGVGAAMVRQTERPLTTPAHC